MSDQNSGKSAASSVLPNAEQTKSAVSWVFTTFGAGIAGFVAGKGWASTQTVMNILSNQQFITIVSSAVMTVGPLIWGLYVHTKKYATEVVDAIPEVKGVITEASADGMALAKSIPSPTVTTAGTPAAIAVAKT
jgi:hypothetical protein